MPTLMESPPAVPELTLAHFSDVHLPLPAGRPALRDLLSKRALGYLSWRRSRQRIHRPEVLAALLADVHRHAPDHIAVTGDLTNLSLPAEFALARAWLGTVGPADRVTVIPGNHDALVAMPWAEGLGSWREWMRGDEGRGDEEAFPFARVRGRVALVGLSSAVPTAPLLATGRIGAGQVGRLAVILEELGRQDLFRIVLVHHPIHRVGEKRRKSLRDGDRLAGVLARSGAELVLHGHGHVGRLDALPGPVRPIASLGCSSASARPVGRGHKGEAARWHLLAISRPGPEWQVRVTVRRLDPAGTGFETVGTYSLAMPAAVSISG